MRTKGKKVKDSTMTMTELVLPNHTNQVGSLLGGQLMLWIDLCAAMCAAKHNNRVCVTASVDKINFLHPAKVGDAVTIMASVNRVFNTSLEVGVTVFADSFKIGSRIHTNSAYLTFVAVDENGNPVKAVPVIPESKVEKRRYEEALSRRNIRLKTLIGKK